MRVGCVFGNQRERDAIRKTQRIFSPFTKRPLRTHQPLEFQLRVQTSLLETMWRVSQRFLTTKRIDKVVIANRGEIACRVIRSANKLAIKVKH